MTLYIGDALPNLSKEFEKSSRHFSSLSLRKKRQKHFVKTLGKGTHIAPTAAQEATSATARGTETSNSVLVSSRRKWW